MHAADIQDRDGGVLVIATLFGLFPFLLKLYADGGYQGPVFQTGLKHVLRQVDVEIVKRSDAVNGFTVLPKRWIVERTIAWLFRCRRLAKDWECLNRKALAKCIAQLGSARTDHPASATGEANTTIASRLGISNPTICHWRKIWFENRLTGLYGEAKPGRARTHDEERIASLLRTVLDSKPVGATHWTVRSAAAASGLSKTTVARVLALFNVRPHRSKTFRLSSDPLFVEKVRDIV